MARSASLSTARSGRRFDLVEALREPHRDRAILLLHEAREFVSVGILDDDRRDEFDAVLLDARAVLLAVLALDGIVLDVVDAGGLQGCREVGELTATVATPVATPHFHRHVIGDAPPRFDGGLVRLGVPRRVRLHRLELLLGHTRSEGLHRLNALATHDRRRTGPPPV